MKKKLGIIITLMCLWLIMPQGTDTVWAAGGTTSVSVSSGNVNIGDTVTVTVKASGPSGEQTVATMTLSYDASVLEFVSCDMTTYGGGGGSVIATGESYTVTLKAIAAGSSAISVSGSDGVIFDTLEELDSMSGSSASVTVNNAAGSSTTTGTTGTSSAGDTTTGTQSADNSLKSLTISPGTLSPSFSGTTTTYSATVDSDVTSIAVSATPANDKATVESVTGNTNLKAGANTIKIVVKAENGVTATYTINVTKSGTTAQTSEEEQGEETSDAAETTEGTVTVSGAAYLIAEDFTAEDIPADFTEAVINYHGTEYKGVSFDKGTISLLWMKQADTEVAEGSFFVYDSTRDTCYPFVKLSHGTGYVIALLAPIDFTMPENYVQTDLVVGDAGSITAYQITQEDSELVSDFYLFYGVNADGTEGWYQYDALEGTYQRVNDGEVQLEEEEEDDIDTEYLQEEYDALYERYTEEKSFSRNVIAILIFVIAVLVIVIVNLLLHRFRDGHDDDFTDDDYEDKDGTADDSGDEKLRGIQAKKSGEIKVLDVSAGKEKKLRGKALVREENPAKTKETPAEQVKTEEAPAEQAKTKEVPEAAAKDASAREEKPAKTKETPAEQAKEEPAREEKPVKTKEAPAEAAKDTPVASGAKKPGELEIIDFNDL